MRLSLWFLQLLRWAMALEIELAIDPAYRAELVNRLADLDGDIDRLALRLELGEL